MLVGREDGWKYENGWGEGEMAIQGIVSGFADPDNMGSNVILIGRGAGYTVIVDGEQRGEQEPTLEAGFSALAKACEGKAPSWREVRGTSTDGLTGRVRVTELGASVMGDFDLRA